MADIYLVNQDYNVGIKQIYDVHIIQEIVRNTLIWLYVYTIIYGVQYTRLAHGMFTYRVCPKSHAIYFF